jgi:hypothetical protein
MRVHTAKLHYHDFPAALERAGLKDITVESTLHGSRKRDRAYEVQLDAAPIPGRRRRNSGTVGAGHGYGATWDEWGEWIAQLYLIDREAIIGPYNGFDDFHVKTGGKYLVSGRETVQSCA